MLMHAWAEALRLYVTNIYLFCVYSVCMHIYLDVNIYACTCFTFIFSSAFTVLETKWSDNFTQPHEIVVSASMDNLTEDNDLPLAPWY